MTLTRRTPLTRTPMPRGRTRVKPVNAKRRKSEFARCYESRARVAWIKSLPCLARGQGYCGGDIQNAHTATGGTGRKADASTVVPLCLKHHAALHTIGARTFASIHRLDLAAEAARVEGLWQDLNRNRTA